MTEQNGETKKPGINAKNNSIAIGSISAGGTTNGSIGVGRIDIGGNVSGNIAAGNNNQVTESQEEIIFNCEIANCSLSNPATTYSFFINNSLHETSRRLRQTNSILRENLRDSA